MDVTILSRDNKTLGKGTKRLFVTFDNTDVSIVNALRRVITTNIQTLVFRGFPYKDNQINILKFLNNLYFIKINFTSIVVTEFFHFCFITFYLSE